MSENIEYYGTTTISDKKTAEEFETLCMEQGWDTTLAEKTVISGDKELKHYSIRFSDVDGTRGGGRTCKEILEGEFEDFLQEHPEVYLEIECTYLDQAPVITETLDGEDYQ